MAAQIDRAIRADTRIFMKVLRGVEAGVVGLTPNMIHRLE
jgi:hypothetical protein